MDMTEKGGEGERIWSELDLILDVCVLGLRSRLMNRLDPSARL